MQRPEWIERHGAKASTIGVGVALYFGLAPVFSLPEPPLWLAKILMGIAILLIVFPLGMMLPWFQPSPDHTRKRLTVLIALGNQLLARLAPDTTDPLSEI